MRQFVLPSSWRGENSLVLTGREHHYLSRVLRLSPGAGFPAVDGNGLRYTCRIRTMDTAATSVTVTPTVEEKKESEIQLTLLLSIPKGKKMDQVIRQATECGVHRLIPFLSEHCTVQLDTEDFKRKQERWQKIAREALQQSGTRVSPDILLPIRHPELEEATRDLDKVFFFHEKALDGPNLHELLHTGPRKIGLLIGPEGGFSNQELELFFSLQYYSVYLGDSVLRAETAALYAVAAVQTILRESRRWQLQSPEHGA
jgi:16S rRNA (uracil1498-N3)-methyltransferase